MVPDPVASVGGEIVWSGKWKESSDLSACRHFRRAVEDVEMRTLCQFHDTKPKLHDVFLSPLGGSCCLNTQINYRAVDWQAACISRGHREAQKACKKAESNTGTEQRLGVCILRRNSRPGRSHAEHAVVHRRAYRYLSCVFCA